MQRTFAKFHEYVQGAYPDALVTVVQGGAGALIDFPNGRHVSVRWSGGHYCDHGKGIEAATDKYLREHWFVNTEMGQLLARTTLTAEVAFTDGLNQCIGEPLTYQTWDEVAQLLDRTAKEV